MFTKILIANRGEILVRVCKTLKAMNIASVAVYSDADRFSPGVLAADEAVHIGPAAAALSYLNIEAIIAACKQTGAEAVHPGYGFSQSAWNSPAAWQKKALSSSAQARRICAISA
jgi:urea carboxylase